MKYLIVGLGNIGPDYVATRHNIGFEVIDMLAQRTDIRMNAGKLGEMGLLKYKGRQIYLLKPSTYMNLSGKAVKYWMDQLKIEIENILIIVDEIQLDFGVQRLRPKGSDGGHNGLKNINVMLNTTSYPRLRLGIGSAFSRGNQINYVLGKWTEEEIKDLGAILEYATDIILSFCTAGIQNTMEKYNQKRNKLDPDSNP